MAIKMKLDDLQGGVLSEKINCELEKIFENIKDPNTDQTKVRSLSISLKFKPNKNADMVEMIPTLKTTLQPVVTEPTTIIVDRDFNTGKIIAKEYNNQIKGQLSMEDIEESEGEETKNGNVIDLMATK